MSEARNTAETWQRRAEKAEADALVLIANNETLQREAKDAWRRVDEYARIVQRVVGVCEDKYVGPPTEYGQGFQEGYNDAMGVVQAALNAANVPTDDEPCPTLAALEYRHVESSNPRTLTETPDRHREKETP